MGFLGGLFGPKIPKPGQIAAQQMEVEGKKQDLHYANLPNISGPGLSETHGTGPDGRPTVQYAFDPTNQGLFDQAQANRGNIGQGVGGLIGNYMGGIVNPFNGIQSAMNTILGGAGTINSVNRDFWADQENREINRLRNQGLSPGQPGDINSAYNKQLRQLALNQSQQFNNAILPWAQFATQSKERDHQQNLKTIGDLLGISGPNVPVQFGSFAPPGISTPNMAQVNATYVEQQQKRMDAIGKLIGTVAGLPFGGGTLAGAVGSGVSGMLGMGGSPWTQPGYVPSPVNQFWT